MLQTSHRTHPSTPTPVLTLRCRSNRNVGSCKQKKCFQSSPTNGCRYSLSPGQAPHQKFACLMFLPPPIANTVADLMAHEYETRHLPQLRSQTAKLTLSHMHWQWCCSLKIGRGSGASGSQSCPGVFERKSHTASLPPMQTANHLKKKLPRHRKHR